jgi:hypothetical protein
MFLTAGFVHLNGREGPNADGLSYNTRFWLHHFFNDEGWQLNLPTNYNKMDERERERERERFSPAYKFSVKCCFHVFLILLLPDTHKEEKWKVLQDNKRCHTMITSKNAKRRKDASIVGL